MRFLAAFSLAAFAVAAAAQEAQRPYGFRGFEIYKLDRKTGLLRTGDIDGDGMTDLLVANNDRAKIEVLLRRKEPVAPKKRSGGRQPNVIRDDRFYERKEILTEKQVSSLDVADLNGDGFLDVAYYGKPEELVVAYGDGKGAFATKVSFPLDEGSRVAAGDLDGDGRTDLVLLEKDVTSVLYQSPKGVLQEPVKVPHSEKGANGVMLRDLDGDGRTDLLLSYGASPRPLRARFQRADGSLGAEVAFAADAWRALDVVDIDPAPGAGILAVQRTSGVLRALTLAQDAGVADALPLGTIELHSFERAGKGKPRSIALGDVDGDGRTDIVVTEPARAQVALYLQAKRGGLKGRRLFPSLSNTESVRVADLDGDGRGEVVVLSGTERAVGIARFEKNRLPFPELLPLPGDPAAVDAADMNGDGRADLAIVVEKDKAQRLLVFLQQEEGGLVKEPRELVLAEKKKPLDALRVIDVDQDGRRDLLLFDGYGPLRVWRAEGDGRYVDLAADGGDYRSGLVTRLAPGNVNPADLDGDGKEELLVASKNFARAIVLEGGSLRVTDQANGSTPRSQIKGAAALDLDGDGTPEVALYDHDRKAVTVLKRDDAGVFAVAAHRPAGDLDFQALHTADLNGDGRADLVLFGRERFGVFYGQGRRRALEERHVVESSVEGAYLGPFAVGDLNGDAKPDVAVLDQGKRAIQIFAYDPQAGFAEELHFPVYEMKLHEQRGRTQASLRDIVVEDLDGDGQDDIAILVHDRLIVYLQ